MCRYGRRAAGGQFDARCHVAQQQFFGLEDVERVVVFFAVVVVRQTAIGVDHFHGVSVARRRAGDIIECVRAGFAFCRQCACTFARQTNGVGRSATKRFNGDASVGFVATATFVHGGHFEAQIVGLGDGQAVVFREGLRARLARFLTRDDNLVVARRQTSYRALSMIQIRSRAVAVISVPRVRRVRHAADFHGDVAVVAAVAADVAKHWRYLDKRDVARHFEFLREEASVGVGDGHRVGAADGKFYLFKVFVGRYRLVRRTADAVGVDGYGFSVVGVFVVRIAARRFGHRECARVAFAVHFFDADDVHNCFCGRHFHSFRSGTTVGVGHLYGVVASC